MNLAGIADFVLGNSKFFNVAMGLYMSQTRKKTDYELQHSPLRFALFTVHIGVMLPIPMTRCITSQQPTEPMVQTIRAITQARACTI